MIEGWDLGEWEGCRGAGGGEDVCSIPGAAAPFYFFTIFFFFLLASTLSRRIINPIKAFINITPDLISHCSGVRAGVVGNFGGAEACCGS